MKAGASQHVGQAVRKLREDHQLTQDDVARAMRRAGVSWRQTSVAALEKGQRRLTLEEFIGLGSALGHLTGKAPVVAFLADGGATIDIGGTRIPVILPGWQRAALDQMRENERALRVWPGAGREDLQAAHADASGDAELKAARRLRASALVVALAARRLWKRSLTEERDRRVTAELGDKTEPRTVQAVRGHVTRALLAELQPALRPAKKTRQRT